VLLLSASETKQGHSPGAEKPNQDFMLQRDFESPYGTAYLHLVADGHGTNGHHVSQLVSSKVCDEIQGFVQDYQDKQSTPYADYVKVVLDRIFEKVDAGLAGSGIDVKNSGSTLTVALIWQNVLAVAYVGDSKAVLLSKIKNLINVALETGLHHPEEPIEKKRIQEAGGMICPFRNEEGQFEGPMRVWKPDFSGPGLAVARSFGDTQGKQVGVTCKPGNPR
jgi:serine/threonine protein phosphatase PrpC